MREWRSSLQFRFFTVVLNKRRFFLSIIERFNKSFLKSWELGVSSRTRDRSKRHRFSQTLKQHWFSRRKTGRVSWDEVLKIMQAYVGTE